MLLRVILPVACLALPGGAIYLAHLPYWRIRNISVQGESTPAEKKNVQDHVVAQLKKTYALIIPADLFFLVHADVIQRAVEQQFLSFARAAVTKQFPDSMAVVLTKRKLFGVYCNDLQTPVNPTCAYLDETGFLYDLAPTASGSLLLRMHTDSQTVATGTQVFDRALMQRLTELKNGVARTINANVLGFERTSRSPGDLRMQAAEGFSLIVKEDDDIAALLKVLRTVMANEIKDRRSRLDYIDLRFGNKVFFKLK